MYYTTLETPVGKLLLTADASALTGVYFADRHALDNAWVEAPNQAVLVQAATQLMEYFSSKRDSFELPLAASGTEFQRQVWQALRAIPYGETRSYADIAKAIGRPLAVRAVGAANGANPISIIIPCHRVVGSNGRLTGYAGGMERKQQLLALEGREFALTSA